MSNKRLIEYTIGFLENYNKENTYSLKTIENYTRGINRFRSWIKESNLSDIMPINLSINHIKQYSKHLSNQNIQNITKKLYLTSLRRFLLYLAENNISSLSLENVKLPKAEIKKPKELLTEKELEKLINRPKTSHNIGLRDRLILEILVNTGLKVSELSSINRNQIIIDKNTCRAEIKINGNRKVYLSDNVVIWLKKYLKQRKYKDKALFINYRPGKKTSKMSRRLTPRSIERLVRKYGIESGLSYKITPEFLRNTYILNVLNRKTKQINKIFTHLSFEIKQYSPAFHLPVNFKKEKDLNWNTTEEFIEKEILWIKNNIETMSTAFKKDSPLKEEELVLRKLAILIVSGKVKVIKFKSKKKDFWNFDSLMKISKNHRHGKDWHNKIMNVVHSYFESRKNIVEIEPILNYGRADLGIFNLESPIYIEIGTVVLYKLLYNLLTMKNSIFLIIPSEDYIIELRT